MTVGVDYLQGADEQAPGLWRAEQGLLEGLKNHSDFLLHPIRFGKLGSKTLFPFIYGPLPIWTALRFPRLLHVANAWYAHLVPLVPRPAIVTCHDLIQMEDGRDTREVKAHRRFHARASFSGMLKARVIVCDSQAVAKRLTSRAPHIRDRVRVVHLGISPVFKPGPSSRETLERLDALGPFVLYVGSEQKRKNLEGLVEAIATARRRVPVLRFVKVGAHQTQEGRQRLLDVLRRENLLSDTVFLEHVSDEDLVELYRGAMVTALPSLQEGFGFPALEAMACGGPVLVSNRDSLPELTGDDALVVDPLNVRSMARAIEQVVCDPLLRHDLKQRGPRRTAGYTWQAAASAYAGIYAEALGKR